MANLGTFTINTHGTHVNLETATEQSFTSGNTYRIQPIDGDIWLREGTDGEGDYVRRYKFAYVDYDGTDLYINTNPSGTRVNIAESSAS